MRVRRQPLLVDVLHGGRAGTLRGNLLNTRRSRGLSNSLLLIDVKTESNHAVDALGEARGLLKNESGSQEGGLVEEIGEIADRLISLVLRNLALELLDDRVGRVQLESLLRGHVRRHRGIPESLGLHDTLHVGAPAELASDKNARRVSDAGGDDDLLDLVAESLLDSLAQVFERRGFSLAGLLLIFGLLELQTILGNTDEFLAVKFLELGDGIFVDGIDEEQDLEALLLQLLEERRVTDGREGFTSEIVDRLLLLRHASDIVIEAGLLVEGFGGEEAEEFGELAAVLRVLVNTKLDVLAESLVELLEVILVLRELGEKVHTLLDDVLSDDLEDLVLLEGLTGDVEREVLGVNDTLDEVEIFGDEVLALSMMKTRRTYSLMLLRFFLVSKRSKGARLGMKRRAVNSSCPSTEKCLTARWSSQSLLRDL